MFIIHHLTYKNNIDNILENGLMGRNKLQELGYEFTDTAENDIILKRNELNNYIPFHFSFILSKKENQDKKVMVGYNGVDGKEVTLSKFKEDINEIRDNRSTLKKW